MATGEADSRAKTESSRNSAAAKVEDGVETTISQDWAEGATDLTVSPSKGGTPHYEAAMPKLLPLGQTVPIQSGMVAQFDGTQVWVWLSQPEGTLAELRSFASAILDL